MIYLERTWSVQPQSYTSKVVFFTDRRFFVFPTVVSKPSANIMAVPSKINCKAQSGDLFRVKIISVPPTFQTDRFSPNGHSPRDLASKTPLAQEVHPTFLYYSDTKKDRQPSGWGSGHSQPASLFPAETEIPPRLDPHLQRGITQRGFAAPTPLWRIRERREMRPFWEPRSTSRDEIDQSERRSSLAKGTVPGRGGRCSERRKVWTRNGESGDWGQTRRGRRGKFGP